jgi:catechol 2,3-dioxygenase-like lactoylglutathione lyase family enzyme
MLEKAQLTAFLASANARRTKAFYQKTLGLRLLFEDRCALVFTRPRHPSRCPRPRQAPCRVRALPASAAGRRRALDGALGDTRRLVQGPR